MTDFDTEWIEFVDQGKPWPGAVTHRWAVREKKRGLTIGLVQWFGNWRQYAFVPMEGSLFEQDCLRAIATFVEAKTREQREGWLSKTKRARGA